MKPKKAKKVRSEKLRRKTSLKNPSPQIKILDEQERASLWTDLGEEVDPPVQSKVQVLPLDQLSWEGFERLCYRLALRSGDSVDGRIYGVPGQQQMGIDVLVTHRRSKKTGARHEKTPQMVSRFAKLRG